MQSQNDQEMVFGRITKYQVGAGHEHLFRTGLFLYVAAALKEAGNIMAEAYIEPNHNDSFWIMERWSAAGAWQDFQNSAQTAALRGLLDGEVHVSTEELLVNDLKPLSKSQWRRNADPNDRPFTIMLIVHANPGSQNEFRKIYDAALPEFRGEAGVVTYQLSQARNDETLFVTYEKFRSEEAFQYHLKFPPIKPILRFLQTSIQHPPFEKGLHRLIKLTPDKL